MDHDVVISYSRKDSEVAHRVKFFLQSRNIRCWMDVKNIAVGSANYGADIAGAIQHGKALVLLLSEHSNGSPHVAKEVGLAVDIFEKTVFVVRLDDIPPGPGIAYHLVNKQMLNAFPPPLEPRLEALVNPIEILLQRSPTTPPSHGDVSSSHSGNRTSGIQGGFSNLMRRFTNQLLGPQGPVADMPYVDPAVVEAARLAEVEKKAREEREQRAAQERAAAEKAAKEAARQEAKLNAEREKSQKEEARRAEEAQKTWQRQLAEQAIAEKRRAEQAIRDRIEARQRLRRENRDRLRDLHGSLAELISLRNWIGAKLLVEQVLRIDPEDEDAIRDQRRIIDGERQDQIANARSRRPR